MDISNKKEKMLHHLYRPWEVHKSPLYTLCCLPLPMSLDPSMALDMVKGTFTNVLPMIAIGGWINWTFSGFLASQLFMDNEWMDRYTDG